MAQPIITYRSVSRTAKADIFLHTDGSYSVEKFDGFSEERLGRMIRHGYAEGLLTEQDARDAADLWITDRI